MRSLRLALVCSLGFGAFAGACSTPAEDGDPEDAVAVDEGKEDNFLSQDALEYTLEGKASVTLDASYATKTDAERMAAAKKLIGYKQIAIAWFVDRVLRRQGRRRRELSLRRLRWRWPRAACGKTSRSPRAPTT